MEIPEMNMDNLMSAWPLPPRENSGWVLTTREGSKYPCEKPADTVVEKAINNLSKRGYHRRAPLNKMPF